MSTRRATDSNEFRQERFASAPEFERGLMANLVAKRCSILARREDRRLIWFLQKLSHDAGGLKSLVQDLKARYPKRISNPIEAALRDWDPTATEKRMEKDIAELALDPGISIEDGKHAYFKSLVTTLREYQSEWIAAQRPAVVTSIGQQICSTLEYSVVRRKLAIIDGTARIGKTHAAKAWCGVNPGAVRYVECPASNDDNSFFREIAQRLGVSVNLNSKAQELRARIEETLRSGDLALVIDEAHYLWPQQRYIRNTTPTRVNWIMTALVNRGIAVTLITTPQFFQTLATIERMTSWTSDQFKGRIGRYVKLPDVLSRDELEDVAKVLLPGGDAKSIRALVLYAESSGKYLGALEAVADTAQYFCESDDRQQLEFKDVERAIRESVTPSDEALKAAFATASEAKRRRISKVIAAPMQSDLERVAMQLSDTEFPARETAPARQTKPKKMVMSPG